MHTHVASERDPAPCREALTGLFTAALAVAEAEPKQHDGSGGCRTWVAAPKCSSAHSALFCWVNSGQLQVSVSAWH